MTTTKTSIPEVFDRFAAYYDASTGEWGALHIVLADGNVKDDDVWYCIADATTEGDAEGADLGRILLTMSRTQRRKLSAMVYAARRG